MAFLKVLVLCLDPLLKLAYLFPVVLLLDELLQEQRADMDQFTSSISENPVDVRVSSEESEEIPPFHPLHPFPSLSENEGMYGPQSRS